MPKRKKEIRPGSHVGQPSSADDGAPLQALRRRLTVRAGDRGRKQPPGRPPTNLPAPRGDRSRRRET